MKPPLANGEYAAIVFGEQGNAHATFAIGA
jgi:hypothetical protein